jgi:hypothetical protein
MKILDLFAGKGGEARRAEIERRGHEYVTLDYLPKFNCTITADLFDMSAKNLGSFDFVWASPPCEAFSVASMWHHWGGGNKAYIPKTKHAELSQRLVKHTLKIIGDMKPKAFLLENPRGILRKLPFMKTLPRTTISYCQYGEKFMKPTDLWGFIPGWSPRPMCKNGRKCHESSPRISHKGGIRGLPNSVERAIVPIDLWREILDVVEGGSKSYMAITRQNYLLHPAGDSIVWA